MRRLAAAIVVLMSGSSVAAAGDPLTFDKDIAPLVFRHCSGCHQPGGSAPFSLLAARDFVSRARQIAAAVRARVMPPWKPQPGHGDFADARRLTDDEITLITRWLDEGGKEGDAADLPTRPIRQADWALGPPDLVVTLSEPYAVATDGPDVFRNFVLPVSTSGVRYVRAWEFRPGNARAVHHASIHLDSSGAARQLDAQDPEPGYEGLVPFSVSDPEGYFLGWTPGQQASTAGPDVAWALKENSDLVVMMHMVPTGKPETVQPSIGLYFTAVPPARVPATLRLGRQDLDIAPGLARYTARDSYVLPVDVQLQSVYPHAHYLARQVTASAKLPDGTERPLLSISDWDFKWQDVYRYVAPVALPAGTTVTVEFTYDNSAANPRNPFAPPRRVTFGKRAFDEMGDVWLQVVPQRSEELQTLVRSFAAKSRPETIRGLEMMLRADPHNRALHDQAALLYQEEGDWERAAAHLSESVRIAPESATAHGNLGTARLAQRRPHEAIQPLERAIHLDPAYRAARNNLAIALQQDGRLSDAVAQYRELLHLDPEDATAHYNLATVLQRTGGTAEATQHLRQAIRVRPGYSAAEYLLATIFDSGGQLAEAVDHYRAAVAAAPDSPSPLLRLAWILATCPDASIRRPGEALVLVRRAEAVVGSQSVAVADVMAAALAALGEFDRAIPTARTALALAVSAGNAEAADEIRHRLSTYESRTPYIAPAR